MLAPVRQRLFLELPIRHSLWVLARTVHERASNPSGITRSDPCGSTPAAVARYSPIGSTCVRWLAALVWVSYVAWLAPAIWSTLWSSWLADRGGVCSVGLAR